MAKTFVYLCDAREVNGERVPDVQGLRRWRVISDGHPAMGGKMVVESDVELSGPGVEPAPETWPNGQPIVDDACIIEWREGV